MAKAYNDAANAQIDAQLSRLEYVSGLIDSVRPELSDVQQKAQAAKQRKAATEQLKAQGYDPSSESLAQFELRIAKAKYELEERQRQLKAQALNREQELAQANLAIEREKLVISQKRSQLEIEKELSELRRSKIEEQKNLRNAASDEERAAIQESIDLIDKELAATSEKSELLDKQYLQEQSILDIKQQQLRIEQESANAQLQAEQDLERWRSRHEYTSQGGKITDLQPRRDPNLQYGQRQSFEDLNRNYPTQIPVPQTPDLSKAFERGNQSIVTKLDTLIQATKARPLAQVTNNVELTNKIDRDTDASLLRKTRSQTLEDFTSLFKKSINAIA